MGKKIRKGIELKSIKVFVNGAQKYKLKTLFSQPYFYTKKKKKKCFSKR
jgi:hypothetical protein